jgi:hypothetical protein
VGMQVEVRGLVNHKEYNGRIGIITSVTGTTHVSLRLSDPRALLRLARTSVHIIKDDEVWCVEILSQHRSTDNQEFSYLFYRIRAGVCAAKHVPSFP